MTENGRIIIPAALRRELHILPGEELMIYKDNDELRIVSLKHAVKKAQATVRQYTKNKKLVQKLKTMRNQDREMADILLIIQFSKLR